MARTKTVRRWHPETLAATDISDTALRTLRDAAIREVVIAARRNPADSAFTLPELIGLTAASEVLLDGADHALVRADLQTATDPGIRDKLTIFAGLPDASSPSAGRRIRLAYRMSRPARRPGGQAGGVGAVGVQPRSGRDRRRRDRPRPGAGPSSGELTARMGRRGCVQRANPSAGAI